jgi:membrane-associated phospholipid phosphatase
MASSMSTGSTVVTKEKNCPVDVKRSLKHNKNEDVRKWLLSYVEAGTPTVVKFQQFFGVGQPQDTISKKIFYKLSEIYFRAASILGEEITFVILLPFLWWHFPGYLSLHLIFIWSFSCYLGHVFKDLWQLPRPSSPVIPLEKFYAHEYGMPSTHSICAGTFSLIALVECTRLGYSLWIVAPFALLVFISVTCSRLYLGVHSPADLVGGAIVSLSVFLLSFPVLEVIETYIVQNPLETTILLSLFMLGLVLIYPASKNWTNSYGDAATILAVMNGGWVHCCMMSRFGHVGIENAYRLNFGDLIDSATWMHAWGRIFIGYFIVFMTRLIMRRSTEVALTMLLPKSDESPKQRYLVEIPSKFVSYTMVTLSASIWGPIAMHMLIQ